MLDNFTLIVLIRVATLVAMQIASECQLNSSQFHINDTHALHHR